MPVMTVRAGPPQPKPAAVGFAASRGPWRAESWATRPPGTRAGPRRQRAGRWLAGLLVGALVAGSAAVGAAPRQADFGQVVVSRASRQLADWIVATRDHRLTCGVAEERQAGAVPMAGSSTRNGAAGGPSLPFVIVDKVAARVFVFDVAGRLQGAAPALLGLARGDDSAPGIGDLPLALIRPEQRTTPAGRFVADLGRNTRGEEILWIDYGSALSLHRVVTHVPRERRLQRLASPSPADNRISYGCVNVPGEFFDRLIRPAFSGRSGIVYILPETRPVAAVFALNGDPLGTGSGNAVQLALQDEPAAP